MQLDSFQFKTQQPALLLIDWQQAIDHFGHLARSHSAAEQHSAELLGLWRARQWPVVHVRHSSRSESSPYHRDSPWYDFKSELAPLAGELLITKRENCAFAQTDLQAMLLEQGIEELVFAGVLINHSVDATLRMAAGLGFDCYLVPECCPAQAIKTLSGDYISAQQVHDIFLSNLAGEYCQLLEF